MRARSYPAPASGPVPIEVQKQVLEGVPHSTATMNAPSRRAAYRSSGTLPSRSTRSRVPSAATSQGRAPTTATGTGSSRGSDKATSPSATSARHTVSVGTKNSDFHDAGPTAHPNSSELPSWVSRYLPGSVWSCQPSGRSEVVPISPCTIAPSRTTGPMVRRPRPRRTSIRTSKPYRSMTASSPTSITRGYGLVRGAHRANSPIAGWNNCDPPGAVAGWHRFTGHVIDKVTSSEDVTSGDSHFQARDQDFWWRLWDVGRTSLNRENVFRLWSKWSHLGQLSQLFEPRNESRGVSDRLKSRS